MDRRQFVQRTAALGCGLGLAGSARAAETDRGGKAAIIDCHCHAGRGLNYGSRDPSAAPWTTYNDPRWTLRKMAEVGIDRSVIFPINNTTYGKANEEIAGYVRKWPDKFFGFAKHDARTEGGRIRDMLRREVRELGLKGLKLHGVPTEEMAEAAAELSIPILYHPPSVRGSLDMVRAYPRVPFILAHLGSFASRDWREHLRAIEAAQRFPNLHLDTSSVVFWGYLEQAARELPAEQLVFGSDGPLVDCRVELCKVRLLRLPPQREALVLGGNIRRLIDAAAGER